VVVAWAEAHPSRCEIHWKAGKNVGVKAVKKKQKKKGILASQSLSGLSCSPGSTQTRVVTKYEKQPTFFDFFSPPTPPNEDDENAAEIGASLEDDFEVCSGIVCILLLNSGNSDILLISAPYLSLNPLCCSHFAPARRDHSREAHPQCRPLVHGRG
jgi:hypothetical protein